MQVRHVIRAVAFAGVVGLVAAACGGKAKVQGSPTATAAPTRGGQAVFGAEQWPQCLHPLTSCNFATWYHLTTAQPTLPKLASIDIQGNYVASPLITELPTLENGGITQNPFTVTYHLNPKAVWDDGTPITSEDVAFTWKAILYTTGSDTKVGYDKIDQIDTSDPQTVVIKFKEPFADWADLFGGGNVNGYVLKKSAFPNADPNKPDLKNEFTDTIPFSGGPWKLQSWSKSQAVLVRNDKYWGHQPFLDQVTFIPIEEQPQEIASLLSGETSVIFPQASNVSVGDQLKVNPNVRWVSGPTNYGDAFWLNLKAFPFQDKAVRQAFAYGVDRQAIIDTIIKLNFKDATVLQCLPPSFPTIGKWCGNYFSRYTYDPQKSIQLLESAGWDCSQVPNKPCTKDGKPLKVVDYITAGNKRRAAVGALTQQKIKAAGFDFEVKEVDATDLFSNKLPKGDYQLAEYAAGAVVDPSRTGQFGCDQFPSAANGYSGLNTDFWCNQQAWAIMKQSDKELDPAKRLQEILQIQQFEAEDVPALPLYPFINITAWRTDKIAGPVGKWNSASYGTYWNMDEWYIPR